MKKIKFELLEDKIYYQDGYKYQLTENARLKIDLVIIKPIDIHFVSYKNGILTAKSGYAWDGPSGPTYDTKDFMRGSLFHDIIYQLIELGCIDEKYREMGDYLLYGICKKDKMPYVRRIYVWAGVHVFGKWWMKKGGPDILSAP